MCRAEGSLSLVWPMVVLTGVIMIVLGPVLFVTKHMAIVGSVLGAMGVVAVFRGLLAVKEAPAAVAMSESASRRLRPELGGGAPSPERGATASGGAAFARLRRASP